MSQVALITGGANGIGKALVLRMVRAGVAVAIADHDAAAAEKLRSEIIADGGRVDSFQLDVTRADQVKDVVAKVVESHGRIDILANIAGGTVHRKLVDNLSWKEWQEVVDVNLKGTFLFCREVAPVMQRQKSGRIINTSSNYGVTGSPLRAPYSAAKAGVIAFSKSLALELAPFGILVNVVAPGPTDTPRVLSHSTPEDRRQRAAVIPLGRTGRPEDPAEVFFYLTTPESAWITGQTFHVNGGLLMP